MQSGKTNIIQRGMKRLKLTIMGLSETRWKGQGHFNWNGYKIIMSGQAEKGRNGVAVVCDRSSGNAIMGYDTVSDRILSARFRGRKVNITIIEVYAPTLTALEEQDDFFNKLQSTIDRTPEGDAIMVIGDLNAKVGHQKGGVGDTKGGHGLGIQNEAGERLIEFCDGNNLGIMNTWFEQPKTRLYTGHHLTGSIGRLPPTLSARWCGSRLTNTQ